MLPAAEPPAKKKAKYCLLDGEEGRKILVEGNIGAQSARYRTLKRWSSGGCDDWALHKIRSDASNIDGSTSVYSMSNMLLPTWAHDMLESLEVPESQTEAAEPDCADAAAAEDSPNADNAAPRPDLPDDSAPGDNVDPGREGTLEMVAGQAEDVAPALPATTS